MIYILGANGAKASVNENFVATGDPFLVAMVNNYIAELRPQSRQGVSPLAWFYNELLNRGMDVDIDPEDIAETDMPEDATP